METDYQPKHMKQYDSHWSHCCFSGCISMGCPGGCCVRMGYHEAHCPENPGRQLEEYYHDMYVNQGNRRHLTKPIVGNISRFCPECGHKAFVAKRVCFGSDPHIMYRCTECRWRGRNPGMSI